MPGTARRVFSENSNFFSFFRQDKEHKPKILSPDIFRWGRGLPREGVGAKKFGMSLETMEIKFFGRDIPGFCRDVPEVPEKFEKKLCFNSRPLFLAFEQTGAHKDKASTTFVCALHMVATSIS